MSPLQFWAYLLAASLCAIGIAGMLFFDNIIKKVIGFTLLSDGVNVMLTATGYLERGIVPIVLPGETTAEFAARAGLVFPIGIVLTNIVIGVSTTALMLALTMKLYRKYGTLSSSKILREVR